MRASRLCECGCGVEFAPREEKHRFATGRCRTRAWKRRHGYTDPRRTKPYRNGSPAPSKRKADLRVSYRKAIEAVGAHIVFADGSDPSNPAAHERAQNVAASILQPLLTDKQRAALPL